MLHVYFHLKTFFNDNDRLTLVNDRLTLVLILKILILDFVADGNIWVSQTHLVTKHLFVCSSALNDSLNTIKCAQKLGMLINQSSGKKKW